MFVSPFIPSGVSLYTGTLRRAVRGVELVATHPATPRAGELGKLALPAAAAHGVTVG